MGAMRAIYDAEARKKRITAQDQFYTDTTNRITRMQKPLDDFTSMSKKRDELRAQRRANYGAATVGQQGGALGVAASGLRISKGGMSPSARRRMMKAG